MRAGEKGSVTLRETRNFSVQVVGGHYRTPSTPNYTLNLWRKDFTRIISSVSGYFINQQKNLYNHSRDETRRRNASGHLQINVSVMFHVKRERVLFYLRWRRPQLLRHLENIKITIDEIFTQKLWPKHIISFFFFLPLFTSIFSFRFFLQIFLVSREEGERERVTISPLQRKKLCKACNERFRSEPNNL